MNLKLIFLLGILLTPLQSWAEQTITLNDGSVIKGEVVSLTDGFYTINTPSLGQTKIAAVQVASINSSGNYAPPADANVSGAIDDKVEEVKRSMLSNPEMVNDLQELVKDPQVMKIITNPALLQAVTNKDVNAINNNPDAKALADNPKVHALIEKLQAQSAAQKQE